MRDRPSSLELAASSRRIGVRLIARKAVEQTWFTRHLLGLRCTLASLPEPRRARLPVSMGAVDARSFDGFLHELDRVHGVDAVEAIARARLCRAGVRTMYLARAADGEPIYAQWIIRPRDQHLIVALAPRRYRTLAEDEVLLEAAYTFSAYRGSGVMADGMGQLLRIARDEGAASAITYVDDVNLPSLRGCAAVGFELDHVRCEMRRLGVRKSVFQQIDAQSRGAWSSALAPRA